MFTCTCSIADQEQACRKPVATLSGLCQHSCNSGLCQSKFTSACSMHKWRYAHANRWYVGMLSRTLASSSYMVSHTLGRLGSSHASVLCLFKVNTHTSSPWSPGCATITPAQTAHACILVLDLHCRGSSHTTRSTHTQARLSKPQVFFLSPVLHAYTNPHTDTAAATLNHTAST